MALSRVATPRSVLRQTTAASRCFSVSAAALAREKLVILGTGWAGYRLLSDVDKKRYDVSVISDRPDFTFTPLLAGASVGTLEYRATLESVHQYASKSTYHQAWAENIDFDKRSITCTPAVNARVDARPQDAPSFEVPYDKLVVAVGAYAQTFGIPGVKENATFLKTVADAQYIRGRIHRCFEQANLPTTSEEEKRKLLHFCCVGGGPTGIEFAAELHDLITTDMSRAFPNIYKLAQVTVFETGDRVLNAFDANLGSYASKQFEREGIAIKTSHTVTQVTPDTIETKQEAPVPFGLCVWSTGLAPNPLVQHLEAVKKEAKTSSLLTDNFCRVLSEGGQAMDNVYAIGDAAIIDGLMLPATAQVADQKAKWLGQRLNAQIKGKTADQPFEFKDRGVMAYIGGWSAILQTPEPGEGNFHITGKAAWLLWRSAYLAKTLSIRNKILVAYFWFFNWAFSRSMSQY